MSAAAAENRPSDILTGKPAGGATLKPAENLLTPSKTSHHFKEPALISQADFKTVELKQDPERSEWQAAYAIAHGIQNSQNRQWTEFLKEHVKSKKSVSSKGVKTVREEHAKYTRKALLQQENLMKVNETIKALNEKSGTPLEFGQVRKINPLTQPCLQHPEHWAIISTNPDNTIASLYSLAYILQLLYNYTFDDPESRSKKATSKIEDAVQHINDRIGDLLPESAATSNDEDFGLVVVPTHSGEPLELPAQEWKEDSTDDDDSDDDMRDEERLSPEHITIPQNIQEIRSRLGGVDGILQKLFMSTDGVTLANANKEYVDQWDKVNAEIREVTKKSGLYSLETMFEVNFGQLAVLLKGFKSSVDLFTEIENNPRNQEKVEAYNAIRESAKNELKTLQYPSNFLDALVPPLPTNRNETGDGELVVQLDSIMLTLGNRNGVLRDYLHMTARGEPAEVPKSRVVAVCNNLRETISLKYGQTIPYHLSCYDIDDQTINEWLEHTKKLQMLEKQGAGGRNMQSIIKMGMCMEQLKSEYIDYPHIAEAIIGDIGTTERFVKPAAKPKPPASPRQSPLGKKKNKKKTSAVPAPSIHTTESQFIETGVTPGVVTDIVDGREIQKSIVSYVEFWKTVEDENEDGKEKKILYGHNLQLKSHDVDRYAQPTYEFVPASKFKGALQDFKQAGGKVFEVGDPTALKGLRWSQCSIGGVCPKSRDNKKPYTRLPNTWLLVQDRRTKVGRWYTISTLRSKFGDKNVDAARDKYMIASGQKLAPVFSHKAEIDKYERKLSNLLALLEKRQVSSGRGITSKRKSPTRRNKRHEVEDEDEEDEGGAIDITETDNEDDSDISSSEDESDFIDTENTTPEEDDLIDLQNFKRDFEKKMNEKIAAAQKRKTKRKPPPSPRCVTDDEE